nr:TIGR03089 family protein [uncultured Actinoplanes sp.]
MDELLTYRDEATGERVGLPAAQVGRWSAATAALLTDECGLGPGAKVAVLLPPHWQTAVVLLGAWSAGCEVAFRGWSTAGLSPAGPAMDASFVAHSRIGSWLDDVPSARFPFELLTPPGSADASPGYRDFTTAVSAHLGAGAPALTPGPDAAADPDGTTFGSYGAIAADMARRRGITRGDRVLIDTRISEQPLMWLLAPLAAGASVVLTDNLDPVRRASVIASEKITRVLA